MNNNNFPSFLFCIIIALLCFLLSKHKSDGFQSGASSESSSSSSNNFNIVEVSSLLPASTCSNPSSATGSSDEDSLLKLVHNHGPCSPKNSGKANALNGREIFELNQKRVSFKAWTQQPYNNGENKVGLRWESINQEYVVNVGLGSPRKEFTLVMDTGSDLLWTQCQPCKLGNLKGCYKQAHPIFDPSKSSTYSNISCPSNTCTHANLTLGFTECISLTCLYQASYVQGSSVIGFLATESLNIGSNTFKDIIFGCSVVNTNLSLPNIDGIIGLGQGFLSFVEQTSNTYHKVFSYCLPSKPSEIGFLKFGKAKQNPKSLKFTKLGEGYAIDLIGIKLGNTTVAITVKKGASSIDSGTSFTALPSRDYVKLREAYRKAMSQYQLLEIAFNDSLDTCYHIGQHQKLYLPKISFLFGEGLVLDIPDNGVAFLANSSVFCFPFMATPKDGGDIVLFGNAQQKTLEIVYDVAGGKLGFGDNGCK